jgi:hypothetical protein
MTKPCVSETRLVPAPDGSHRLVIDLSHLADAYFLPVSDAEGRPLCTIQFERVASQNAHCLMVAKRVTLPGAEQVAPVDIDREVAA